MPAGRDIFLTANRLKLHLLEWGSGDRVVLLLHGSLEHAHAWDFVAPQLADAGHHVFALDWRGHGDSDWVGAGGYYHFIDYVADLADLIPQLGKRVDLMAHSMGGGAAILFAGAKPQLVRSLTSIEGLGMPDFDLASIRGRVVSWLDDLQRVARRAPANLDLEAAIRRYRERFPGLSEDAARHIVAHNTRGVDGNLAWKFDPLHQTSAPLPTPAAAGRTFWQHIACPVLYLQGAESFLRLPPDDLEQRLAALRARRFAIEAAGHHPHVENPAAVARIAIDFLHAIE